jgi:hypothetical protein
MPPPKNFANFLIAVEVKPKPHTISDVKEKEAILCYNSISFPQR